jgi:ATP-dependent helicase HrpB
MSQLPIEAVIAPLRRALCQRNEVILEAPPGAGKTTGVPLALLREPWLGEQRILILEPRRLAARAAAQRLASQLGEPVGETVGYRIRLESKVGPRTRIEVLTEGVLSRRLQEDPALEGVGLVIFDEFHLRTLEADLALALCLNGRELLRAPSQPLKILLMSATLEGERLARLLGEAPVVTSQGRMYPVELLWGKPFQLGEAIESRVVQTCLQALAEQSGSLLVFLPGQAEIRRVQQLLLEQLAGRSDILLCPLHGALDLSAQRAAIEPAAHGQRKLVLATNVAETSLTIDGVRVVVDGGLARVPRFDPASGMTRLSTQRISRAAAAQRTGRAGRLEPGVCYRLWSEAQHAQLAAFDPPEILQADISALALQLARWGAVPGDFSWLDAPPPAAYAHARTLLRRLGALDDAGTITRHGRAMANLPAHPRIAHLLLCGQRLGLAELACEIAAVLSERDPFRTGGADLQQRLALIACASSLSAERAATQRVRQIVQQYRSLLRGPVSEPVSHPQAACWPGALLALAYPERIARQRVEAGACYRLANGRAAKFTQADALMKEPWLVVADLGSHRGQRNESIYLAAALDPALFDRELSGQVRVHDCIEWDEREAVFRAEKQYRVGELVLRREALPELDEAARSRALIGLLRDKGIALLPWTAELRQWQARVTLVRRWDLERQGQSEWPDVSDTALLASLEQWLTPYLGRVSRLSHFASLDLASILLSLLPWPLTQRLDELAPRRLPMPSGSRIAIDYSMHPPVLAVRLQEVLGLAATPRIVAGQQPLMLHLLSPSSRPVQITQDLASFWANTYAGVKKDLKGRYPKLFHRLDPWVDSLNKGE